MSPKAKLNNEGQFHKMAHAVQFDREKCIGCNSCVMTCKNIGIGFLKLEEKGDKKHVEFSEDPCVDCIYCGQCTNLCPVDAIYEQKEIKAVEKALKVKGKTVIVQMGPSVRASIGEEFGQPPGTNISGHMFSALRELGFDKIFDVTMGADITTMAEAEELVDRIKNKGPLPMFTSCCPSWVKYIEFYHPELIPNLTTARSPHIHSGGAYKTWWAEKEGINPKDIIVVSIMPCTSKKNEAKHEKFKIKGLNPVDHVITTKEAAALLKKHSIDPMKLKPGKVDTCGQFSGAGIIYGASGGVMESALRSTHFYLTGKELKKIDYKEVRDTQSIKKATVKIGDHRLNVAVVYLTMNAAPIIDEIKKNPKAYDYIEVMACPGGCIGGGGQPLRTNMKKIEERKKSLYSIDSKMKIRKAHQNPVVREFFDGYIAKLTEKEQSAILHTSYSKSKKFTS